MARGPGVTIRDFGLSFGTGPDLFAGFSLDIRPGETIALIGRSGIGKTTLLRAVAGVQAGYRGSIEIAGRPAQGAPVPGIVFQDARLLPWLDAAENIRLAAPGIDDAGVEALLAQVGLAGHARFRPRQMSGGMQRRLGLARALAVRSGLLLLDEPFVHLDRQVVRELRSLFREVIAQSGCTALLVSHDPEDASALADRVVILKGRPVRIETQFEVGQARDPAQAADVLARIDAAIA